MTMKHMEQVREVGEELCKKVLKKMESILDENSDGSHLSSQELADLKDCCKILRMVAEISGPAPMAGK